MSIKSSIFFLFILLSNKLFTQPVDIPKGVHYKIASDSINNAAKKIIMLELAEPKNYSLFDKLLYVGPQLWSRYQKIPALNNIPGGNTQINIPQYDKQGNVVGQKSAPAKLIQNTDGFKLLWDQLIQDLSADTVNIRKLTSKEIEYYWAVIFYDIEEPVFAIENRKIKILMQLTSDQFRLFWIDELLF
jgi:hypothetical protein